MLQVSLKEIMTENVVTISKDQTVGGAAHLLLRFRINGIVIVDTDDARKIVGIFTTTDLLRLLETGFERDDLRLDKLQEISAQPLTKFIKPEGVFTLQQDMNLLDVITVMRVKNIHTIPICNGKELVGIVGRHDILNAAFAS